MMRSHENPLRGALLATVLLTLPLTAQCESTWLPGYTLPGLDGVVSAGVDWDPDGPGPAEPLFVLGGSFRVAGDAIASSVVAYDPATRSFQAFGAGLAGSVYALTVLPNGHLVAGGFTNLGAGLTQLVAEWDGSQWLHLDVGAPGTVIGLAATPNGELIAMKDYFSGPSVIRSWDGSNWTTIPGTPANAWALCALPNGDLAVGTDAAPATNVWRWDGATWTTIGGTFNGPVHRLQVGPNGELVAGGRFTTAGGQPAALVAQWDGVAWQGYGNGLPWTAVRPVQVLRFRPNGNLIVAGTSNLGLTFQPALAEWDGSTWTHTTVTPAGPITAATIAPNGDLLVGGDFYLIDGQSILNGARWDGSSWHPLCDDSTDGPITEMVTLHDGSVVATGTFTRLGDVALPGVARWDGVAWNTMGTGFDGDVNKLFVRQDGSLIAGGSFTSVNGVAAPFVARWDGSSWHSLGNPGSAVRAITEYQGDLVVNSSDIAAPLRRQSGAGWVPFGPAGAVVNHMVVDGQGTLFIAGAVPNGIFAQVPIGRYDGQYWWPIPSISNGIVNDLLILPDGRLCAVGGGFNGPSGFVGVAAAWNGATWQNLGCPLQQVRSATVLPDGRLAAAYLAAGSGQAAPALAIQDGASWTTLGVGSPGLGALLEHVEALAARPDGDLLLGGAFRSLDGFVNVSFAVRRPDCPATAIPFGAGCAGSAGPVSLTATRAPWIGGAGEARVEGLAPLTLLVSVYGFQQIALPLDLVFAQAGTGCVAWTTGDFLGVQLPTGNSATTTLTVPDDPALVGATIHHYALPFEFTAGGAVAQVTSSNALSLTIGALGY